MENNWDNNKLQQLNNKLNNKELEELMREIAADKTQENVLELMQKLKTTRFLVPAQFPKNMKREEIARVLSDLRSGKKERMKMTPVIVHNEQGDHFAPAFTSSEHIPKDQKYQAILNVTFAEILRVVSNTRLNLSGIIINPFTDKTILLKEFLNAYKKLNGEDTETKKIKMTREQFAVFARTSAEWGLIPREMYTNKDEFIRRLEDERERYIVSFYEKPYRGNVPCPYTADDFGMIMLSVNENTSIAAIETPKKNLIAQNALSIFIVWDPLGGDIHYFLIENGKKDQDNMLSRVTPKGDHIELKPAPAPGNEISAILELIEEEKNG